MAKKTLEKNSLLRYFEIYKDKFFKIVLLNIFYFTALSILLVISGGLAYLLFTVLKLTPYLTPLALLPMILLGPLTAGVIKMCRDFVRSEPGFFFEDFKSAVKSNFKQSIVIALLQYIVIWGLFVAIPFYYQGMNLTKGGEHVFYTVGLGIALFAALLLVIMSYYAYMMCVTLKLKIWEIIKNSFIFTFLCLLKNILLTVILGVFCAATYDLVIYAAAWKNAIVWGLVICFFMAIFFGFIFYTVSFFTFPSIKRYILDPYYEEHPELTANENDGKVNAGDSIDYNAKNADEGQSEYVYMNGRLIPRSALNTEAIFEDKADTEEDKTPEKKLEEIKAKYKNKR